MRNLQSTPIRDKYNQSHGDFYESTITHKEPDGEGARDRILEYEKKRADEFNEELKKMVNIEDHKL